MHKTDNFPSLRKLNGRRVLFVDGKPFIMLGLQWDCDWCYSPYEMEPYFEQAKKMCLNTVSLLLYWKEVEPEKDVYDFAYLDRRIELARKYGLKIILVWFASFKNAGITYAPDYIRRDHETYRKVQKKDGSLVPCCCCPTAENTHARDEKALIKVFEHIKEIDSQEHTVILFQMENETGIQRTDRCYCPICSERYEKEGWEEKYGWRASEAFTAGMIAEYCDSLTKTVKEIYPLSVYVNAALPFLWANSVAGDDWHGRRPGHFNGGPVGRVLDVWHNAIKYIDFISPDIYQPSYHDFRHFCKEYTWKEQPLFIPECATGKGARVEKNVIYAIGEFGAIGIDPWSITRSCPDFMGESLINPSDMRWSCQAYELRQSYKMVKDVMYPLAMAQNTDRLKFFVQEEGDFGIKLQFGEIGAEMRYEHPEDKARGFVIKLAEDEYLISGAGVHIQFSKYTGELVPIRSVEIGHYDDDKWICHYEYTREDPLDTQGFALRDCMTARVTLGRRIDWEAI